MSAARGAKERPRPPLRVGNVVQPTALRTQLPSVLSILLFQRETGSGARRQRGPERPGVTLGWDVILGLCQGCWPGHGRDVWRGPCQPPRQFWALPVFLGAPTHTVLHSVPFSLCAMVTPDLSLQPPGSPKTYSLINPCLAHLTPSFCCDVGKKQIRGAVEIHHHGVSLCSPRSSRLSLQFTAIPVQSQEFINAGQTRPRTWA